MNEPKTPNLGLNKIDRSSPSTTYFDLDKYLDQNWEKVDEGVSQVGEKAEETATQVSSIQERLDTEKRRSVTLEPGLQVVHTERASAFKLEGLKGRTLVNLLGRDGNFVDATKWNIGFGTRTTTNNIITVTGDGSGVNPQLTNYKHISSLTPKVGDKLFLRVLATHIVGTAKQLQLYLYSTTLNRFTAKNIENPVNGTNYELYGMITVTQAIVDEWDTTFGFKLTAEYATYEASNGSQVQFSKAAMYKVADEDKSLTSDQLNVKYPYVDSVQPVLNPYVIRYGENLLPPLYEWDNQLSELGNVNEPYKANATVSDSTIKYLRAYIPVGAGQVYSLSATTVNSSFYAYACDASKTRISARIESGVITTSTGTVYLEVLWSNTIASGVLNGAYSISDPMLIIGTTAQPFKPREDAILALQTDLCADPVTGENADQVFEKDGQYFKLKKWRKRIIDENSGVELGSRTTGYRQLVINESDDYGLLVKSASVGKSKVVKYDGKVMTESGTLNASLTGPDQYYFSMNPTFTRFYFTVSSTDSGWGDSYTPTSDELKAYFMGWKMYTNGLAKLDPYVSGDKRWYPISRINDTFEQQYASAIGILPTIQANNKDWYTPYQLLYQLATPVVEPITTEGKMMLIEGNNQVEVGTGIVLREKATTRKGTDWYIGETFGTGSRVKFTPLRFLNIYRDGKVDFKWTKQSTGSTLQGSEMLRTVDANYDQSATYTVTYLMLATSPIAPFVGSVPDNEKALLTELVQDMQQGATSLSVVERALPAVLSALQENNRNIWGPIE